MEIEEITIQVIKHLEVQTGDTVVFSFPGRLSHAETDRFLQRLKTSFPNGVRVILLEGGATCEGILRFGSEASK